MTNEERHHMEIILEDMNGKFDLLLEGHTTLNQKIDRVQALAEQNHQEALSLIKAVHDSLNATIDTVRDELKDDIHAVGEKVDGHEVRITQLEKKAA